jgi:galactose mutarotase-like enzyme
VLAATIGKIGTGETLKFAANFALSAAGACLVLSCMETYSQGGDAFQRWRVGASVFTACLERGARLMRWEMALPSGNREVIYWPPNADFADIAVVRGGNPVLFPFPGRNYVAGERFFWRDPDGVKRPMPLHGLARQGRFEITASGADFAETRFLPDAFCRECFPYEYEFRVRLRFAELSLRIELELESKETQRDIPWCAGHHFYFGLPWHTGLERADYSLDAAAKKVWRHSADGSLVPFAGVALPANFGDPALADAIFTKLKSNTVVFGPKSGEENVTLRIGEEAVPDAWTTLVTWTEAPTSPFFCVEPWMGPPNCTGHKNGLRKVAAGATESFLVTVGLD